MNTQNFCYKNDLTLDDKKTIARNLKTFIDSTNNFEWFLTGRTTLTFDHNCVEPISLCGETKEAIVSYMESKETPVKITPIIYLRDKDTTYESCTFEVKRSSS